MPDRRRSNLLLVLSLTMLAVPCTCEDFQETPEFNIAPSAVVTSTSGECTTFCNSPGGACRETQCNFTCPLGDISSAKPVLPLRNSKICPSFNLNQGIPAAKSDTGVYIYFNHSGSCVVSQEVQVTSLDSFAVGFWVISKDLECSNQNCEFLEIKHGNERLLSVGLKGGEIDVMIQDTSLQLSADTSKWQHVAVQFTKTTAILVLNGTFDRSLSQKSGVSPKTDLTVHLEAGSGISGGAFAVSGLQVLQSAVSFRELKKMFGPVEEPKAGPNCACAPIHVIEENNVCSTSDGRVEEKRLNSAASYPAYVSDGDVNTAWITPHQVTSQITFHFPNKIYQIVNITIKFQNSRPNTVKVALKRNGELIVEELSQNLPSGQNEFTYSWNLGDYRTSRHVYERTVADTVVVSLEGHQLSAQRDYHSVSEVIIYGRRSCYGSPLAIGSNSKCACRRGMVDSSCSSCDNEYYHGNKLACSPCNCDATGSQIKICNKNTGRCNCMDHVVGRTCDRCEQFYHGLNKTGCFECDCDRTGSTGCNADTGICICRPTVEGKTCDRCKPGHYGFGTGGCSPCACNTDGSEGNECDVSTGKCQCKSNITGRTCDKCREGFWNFPACKPCPRCSPIGQSAEGDVCDQATGKCLCAGGEDSPNCDSEVEGMVPRNGPLAGGTVVTITGKLLGNGTAFTVTMDSIPQTTISRNHTALLFRTVNTTKTGPVKIVMNLRLSAQQPPYFLHLGPSYQFEYRNNPTVKSIVPKVSFASGGTILNVTGESLDSVYRPLLLVYSNTNTASDIASAREICTPVNRGLLRCPAPSVGEIFQGSENRFRLGLQFDGFNRYQTLAASTGTLTVYPDPHVDKWNDTMEFSYPFTQVVEITGKDFTRGASIDEYTIKIGVDVCPISESSSTKIVCKPASSGLDEGDFSVLVKVGHFQAEVGTLIYVPFYKTAIFIGGMCGIGMLFVIIVTIVCIVKRRRKRDTFQNTPKKAKRQTKEQVDIKVEENYYKMDVVPDAPSPPPVMKVAPIPTPQPPRPPRNPSAKPQAKENPPPPPAPVSPAPSSPATGPSTLLDRIDIHTQDIIWEAVVELKHVKIGKICTKKGLVSRFIDGEFKTSSSVSPGNKLGIKTCIKPVPGNETVPAWLTEGISSAMVYRQCRHENILPLTGMAFDSGKMYLLYPAMENRSLKDYLVSTEIEITTIQSLEFALQIAEGMEYLTDTHLDHRDLATRNCMVDANLVVKICDSAFSDDLYREEYAYDADRQRYYPLRWMAIESITNGFHDSKSDVWSYGVVMWELFTRGVLPYFDTKDEDVLRILQENERLGRPYSIPDELDELMASCWLEPSSSRPTFSAIIVGLNQLSHPSSHRPDEAEFLHKGSKRASAMYGNLGEDEPIYGNIPSGSKPQYSVRRL